MACRGGASLTALFLCSVVIGLVLLGATGCYRSHGLDDGGFGGSSNRGFAGDASTPDARSPADAGPPPDLASSVDAAPPMDAAPPVDAGMQCEFSFEMSGVTASCSVSASAAETCREAARCICTFHMDPPWLLGGMSCEDSALHLRALVTLGDYCNANRPAASLAEALQGFGAFWGAEVTTSQACDDIPAVASRR